MTQQTHTGATSTEGPPPATEGQQPVWYGQPTTEATYGTPGAPGAPTNATTTLPYGIEWGAGANGTGDGSGNGAYPPPPPTPAAPAPKAKNGKGGLAQMTAVAVLAAVLASGGTYAATRYAGDGTTASGTTVSAPAAVDNPPAPVAQADPSNPDWTATAKAVAPSVVSITVTSRQGTGQGSGVILDKAGHVVTNNHVATGAGTGATITITLNDGSTYDATVVGTDPTTDLAVLAITNPPSTLSPISIGDSTALTVGQPVMAVGNPLGLAGTVTTGIVSALNRPVSTAASEAETPDSQLPQQGSPSTQAADSVVTNAIQTSAAINPGNSGGALVTADGQLIGINSSIASLGSSSSGSQSGNIGIGFAIPSSEVKWIADDLIKDGKVQHAYLGVSTSDTTVSDGSSKRAAAAVQSVSPGTPAASGGLKQGDAVIAIDGQSVEGSESLVGSIREHQVGNVVTLTVVRDGQKQDLKITLAARPG